MDDPTKDALDEVKSKEGGWVNINAEASASDVKDLSTIDVKLNGEFGINLSPNWAAYGDIWAKPANGDFGALAGVRLNNSLDVFAQASGNINGSVTGTMGLSWKF